MKNNTIGNILILAGILIILFGITNAAHADVLVDNFTDNQETLKDFPNQMKLALSTTVELTGSELTNITRELIVYTPSGKKRSVGHSTVSQTELYIDNTIRKVRIPSNIGIAYKFDTENLSQYEGIAIKTVGMETKGAMIKVSINGSSGFQYLRFNNFNNSNNASFKDDGTIFFPFNAFEGSMLTGVTQLRIDVIGIKETWSGNFEVTLVSK